MPRNSLVHEWAHQFSLLYTIDLESDQFDGQNFYWEADIPLHRECHFISVAENNLT